MKAQFVVGRKNADKHKKMPGNKMSARYTKPKHPTLETNLKLWVVAQREAGRVVSTLSIRMKALSMAKEGNIEGFGANPSWTHRFMKRHRLSVRASTAVGQKLPEDWEEKMKTFKAFS